MWHACASVCKPKGLSLFHIRHKQRKRRDTRLIACRAQLPLRSCHWKPGSTADLSLTIMTHHHIAVTQLHLLPLATLPRCSRQHRYSYYQRFGRVYSKQQVIPKQPTEPKEYGTNHELEIWPLNFRWCWPVWWWYLSQPLRISWVYPNTHVAIHVYVKQSGCARSSSAAVCTVRLIQQSECQHRPNNGQCNEYELSGIPPKLGRLESWARNQV